MVNIAFLLLITYISNVTSTGVWWTRCYCNTHSNRCTCYYSCSHWDRKDENAVSLMNTLLKECRKELDKVKDENTCDSKSDEDIRELTRRLDICNRQLGESQDNLNRAVTQNVRTTITDLATETRFCIALSESDCRGQSSTCVWDSALIVSGTLQGACISARFE